MRNFIVYGICRNVFKFTDLIIELMRHYIKFKNGKLKALVLLAIKKAGSERKLARRLGWPKITIYQYNLEKVNVSDLRLKQLLRYLQINYSELLKKEEPKILDESWGRSKGGINCYKKKLKNQTFELNHKLMRNASSKKMKIWHAEFKSRDPEKYYKLQYKRFRKISKNNFKTINGLLVRNRYEKEIADFLFENRFQFIYEPYVNVFGKAYFPDFLIGKSIIEVTAWKNPDSNRLDYLKKKINDYTLAGFKVYFFIPTKFRNFYKPLSGFVVSELNEMKKALVAQTNT